MSQATRLSALDGLRGWMSLIVALNHAVCELTPLSESTRAFCMFRF